MRKSTFILFLLSCIFVHSSCQPDEVEQSKPVNLRSILSFVLNPYQNSKNNLTLKVTGKIDEANKLITLNLPKNIRLDSLRPEITYSPWASISPANLEYVDLTPDTVEYTVKAQSGKTSVYSIVKDMSFVYTNNNLYAITFPNITDAISGGAVRKTFWSGTYSLTIQVPVGADVKNIVTQLEFAADSQNTNIQVMENLTNVFRTYSNPVDFSKKVTFRVKSEDGKRSTDYFVSVAFI